MNNILWVSEKNLEVVVSFRYCLQKKKDKKNKMKFNRKSLKQRVLNQRRKIKKADIFFSKMMKMM
jgi:type III secretory pathway component EscR